MKRELFRLFQRKYDLTTTRTGHEYFTISVLAEVLDVRDRWCSIITSAVSSASNYKPV